MKNIFFLPILLTILIAPPIISQTFLVQTVRGQVIDKDSRQPLTGATVRILDSSPALGAATDSEGNFEIKNVAIGRRKIECDYLGFESFVSDNLVINSAKEINLIIELIENVGKNATSGEVVISSKKQGNEPLNELAAVSTRSFSVDETQRYAASANDPGRMAVGFPGVQPSRDSRSDIVVRANSALGLGWRLEGVDIPNPNHFARIGTSGGGITVFSTSLLGQSDFSTGAFPAEYGNATAGVFDIHFRKGNAQRPEFTARAGLLGLDFGAEGPFKKGRRASFLVNYRYSTLGILNKLGLHLVGPRTDNTFQDLSFNLNFPSKNNRHIFTIWGIGGLSTELFNAKKQAEWKSFDDYSTYDFRTNMGAVGATHTVLLGDDAFLKTSLAATGQRITTTDDTLDQNLRHGTYSDQRYLEGRYSISSVLNKKFSAKSSLKIGFQASKIEMDLERIELNDEQKFVVDLSTSLLENLGEVNLKNVFLIEPFINWRLRPTDRLTLNLGLHYTDFTLNKKSKAWEPRANISFQLSENQRLSLAYGLHSRVLPLGTYALAGVFHVPPDNYPVYWPSNVGLPLLKAHHVVVAYDFRLKNGFKIHPEIYWQRLFDVPVAGTWSLLNTISGFPDRGLRSTGEGTNYGLDLSLEKAFDHRVFMILSGSIFKSTYRDENKNEHPTQFDSGISASFMGGKEWNFERNRTLQIGWKILFNGGQRLTPLLPGAVVSHFSKEPPFDWSRPFSEKVSPYFRPDLRLAWRKNRAKTAWTLALDIQNIINRKNVDAITRRYDPEKNAYVFREQSGLTPILSFQIDF